MDERELQDLTVAKGEANRARVAYDVEVGGMDTLIREGEAIRGYRHQYGMSLVGEDAATRPGLLLVPGTSIVSREKRVAVRRR
jgi:hypothetical protein